MRLPKKQRKLPKNRSWLSFGYPYLAAETYSMLPGYQNILKKENKGINTRIRAREGRVYRSVGGVGNLGFGNRRSRVDERYVEKVFTNEARKRDAWALKFTSPGTAGVPDRIVLLPGGEVRFVEIKRPGGRPSAIQARVFERFRVLGHPVDVVDSPEAARAWWGSL